MTDALKPILLEVNANPSLRIDFDHTNQAGKEVIDYFRDSSTLIISGKLIHEPSPIDEEIKRPLVTETLKLVM